MAPWGAVGRGGHDLLTDQGETDLHAGPYSVTYSFPLLPIPGATPHDFVSTGAYWWPNPHTPDGLPYIARDGHVNPHSAGSFTQLTPLAEAVHRLGLAYFFTEDETYAQHAAYLARTFFLDPATRMHPHNEFGKIIPGRANTGGFVVAGIGNVFRLLYEGLGLIDTSPHWTAQDKRGMQQWSRAFLQWMEASPKGRREFRAPGNHGTNYDMLATLLSLYLDDEAGARRHVRRYLRRMRRQFALDGAQPLEMPRANNLTYHTYNLLVAADIADLGQRLGMNVWHARTPAGGSLQKGVEFLLPYITGAAPWPFWHAEVFPLRPATYYKLLLRAAVGLREPRLLPAVNGFEPVLYSAYLVNLTHPAVILQERP